MSETELILILIPLFLFLIIFALLRLKKLRQRGKQAMLQRVAGESLFCLDEKAEFFGLKSRGYLQARGLGAVFALTDQALYLNAFDEYGKFHREFRIARSQIQSSEFRERFLGAAGSLLVVQFRQDSGNLDELAIRLNRRAEAAEFLGR